MKKLFLLSIFSIFSFGYRPGVQITQHTWRQISGPINVFIADPDSLRTVVNGLNVPGVYGFEFSIVSNKSINGGDTIVRDTCYVTVNPAVLLPIDLISFSGKAGTHENFITWQTAQEQNVKSFLIQKGSDNQNFLTIASVPGKNLNVPVTYNYTDQDPFEATFYRLKQINNDLSFKFSNVIRVDNVVKFDEVVVENPVVKDIHIRFYSTSPGSVLMNFYNSLGKLIYVSSMPCYSGTNNYSLPVSSYPQGLYLLKIFKDKKIFTKKIIK